MKNPNPWIRFSFNALGNDQVCAQLKALVGHDAFAHLTRNDTHGRVCGTCSSTLLAMEPDRETPGLLYVEFTKMIDLGRLCNALVNASFAFDVFEPATPFRAAQMGYYRIETGSEFYECRTDGTLDADFRDLRDLIAQVEDDPSLGVNCLTEWLAAKVFLGPRLDDCAT